MNENGRAKVRRNENRYVHIYVQMSVYKLLYNSIAVMWVDYECHRSNNDSTFTNRVCQKTAMWILDMIQIPSPELHLHIPV